MGNDAALEYSLGNISGKLVEGVFFGSAKQQLERFWGVESYNELSVKSDITLLPAAAVYVAKAHDYSMQDGRERSAIFELHNAEFSVRDEKQSKESIKDKFHSAQIGEMGISIDVEGYLHYQFNRFVGNSRPILFHTHPGFSQADVSDRAVRTDRAIHVVSGKSLIEFNDFLWDVPSGNDMGMYLPARRSVNSILLSTPNRNVYICPEKISMPVSLKYVKEFRFFIKTENALSLAAFNYLSGVTPQELGSIGWRNNISNDTYAMLVDLVHQHLSLNELKVLRDQNLYRLCDKTGNLLFMSDNSNVNTLTRIK